jgi:CTP synthase
MPGLPRGQKDLSRWREVVDAIRSAKDEVSIGIVGKYVDLADSYKSLNEALGHGGLANGVKVNLVFIDSESLEGSGYPEQLFEVDAILVPGGFGRRGIEGMIRAIEFARGRKIPYFGICLGLQTAMIEFARNVCGLAGAHSTEFSAQPPYKVIYKMRELVGVDQMGGTMRLGKYPCRLKPGSLGWKTYGADEVWGATTTATKSTGVRAVRGGLMVGKSPDRLFVEVVELPGHPWPRLPVLSSSRVQPPIFRSFIAAAIEYRKRLARMRSRPRSSSRRRQWKSPRSRRKPPPPDRGWGIWGLVPSRTRSRADPREFSRREALAREWCGLRNGQRVKNTSVD